MVTSPLGYSLIDGDNHCYQQWDSFTRHLPARYEDNAVRFVPDNDRGGFSVFVGDHPMTYGEGTFNDRGEAQRPGSLKEYLKSLKTGAADTAYTWEPMRDEYLRREPRLALMDEHGVEACLLFPEEALMVEHYLRDVDALYAAYRAFNEWFDEEWGFNHRNRIFAPPYISLADLDRAVTEVDLVLAQGAKVVMMRPGPAYGRSPADPYFDPVWSRLNEAHAAVAYHVTEPGYNEAISVLWGEEPNPPAFRQSPWQAVNTYIDRPIMETLSALVMGNLFGRFPHLRAVSVEHGADWLPYLLRRMDKMRGMARNGPWIGGPLADRPSNVFKQHVLVCPFPEDDIATIAAQVGTDCLLMGSDWPHGEGTATPADYADSMHGMPDADIRAVLHDNGAALLGLPV
jgi:predicted TIM-barrel fold metal-dependent hydrolase